MYGVDLSVHNKNINYDELKSLGIEFAILRSGYGKDEGQKDSLFEQHYAGCKKAGIKVGAYLYSYCTAVENAEKEAENCLRQIAGKTFDLPIYIDLEESRTKALGRIEVTEIAKRFCNKIKNAGYNAGVYANLDWFRNYIDVNSLINEGYSIWLAQWNSQMTADFKVDIWQTTNNLYGKHIDGDQLLNVNILHVDNGEKPVDNTIKELAIDVILGKYGNGQERKDKLGKYYNEVQDLVNKIYKIVKGD